MFLFPPISAPSDAWNPGATVQKMAATNLLPALEFPISNSYLPPYGAVIAALFRLMQALIAEDRRYGAR